MESSVMTGAAGVDTDRPAFKVADLGLAEWGRKEIGQQTEQAFLSLVEREQSRGFARVYEEDEAA
jgi:hypothetical protein